MTYLNGTASSRIRRGLPPSMFKIEKNVPVPQASGRSNTGFPKYPFHSMEVGDSFHVPSTKADRLKTQSKLLTNARVVTKGKKKFTSRQDAKGVRIWRIA